MGTRKCHGVEVLFIVVMLIWMVIERGEALGWPWGGSSSSQDNKSNHRQKKGGSNEKWGDGGGRRRNTEREGRATFETVRESLYQTHKSMIQEGQQMVSLRAPPSSVKKNSGGKDDEDGDYKLQRSCWQSAYLKLFSSCKEILQDEDKKCRLAFEFTRCFLSVTGWPPPSPCPESVPLKSCTQKFDRHTLDVYLAFFVDSVAMCHHLQSEAFQQETDEMINELKHSGHWILHKVKEVEELSHQILDDTFEQSEKLQEKLAIVEAHSEMLLEHRIELEELLNTTLGTVEAVYNNSDEVMQMQKELKGIHMDMNTTLLAGFKELDQAAKHTHQQLDDISQGQHEIAQQQVHLADTLAQNIQRLKESALHSLDELKQSQAMAMEETRSSLKGLSEGARRAQANFDEWRIDLDEKNQLLLRGSEDMLIAQEAFVTKQKSIMATLDRLFSLYDSILYESRALKMFLFYALSLVFLHFITSAKQASSARPLLYIVLCLSMVAELYLMRTHGARLKNQQWLKTQCHWIRVAFAAFSAFTTVFFILTYRDINWRNHALLLEILRKLSESSSHQAKQTITSHHSGWEEMKKINSDPTQAMSFCRPFVIRHTSWKQLMASRIIRRVHKFIGRQRSSGSRLRTSGEGDALKDWMASRGMDLSSLDYSDNSEDDPDFECPPQMSCWTNQFPSSDRYFLRSKCDNRRCRVGSWRRNM
ncbi:hypothetical protein L7F22_062718 [Adiantum nelumboides]|nr:hypothetical protein [Adiantum nelumboides]